MDLTELHQLFRKRDEGRATETDLKRIKELQEQSWAEMEKSVKQRLWEAGEWARKAGLKEMSMEDKKA